jgi:hypothetical protein
MKIATALALIIVISNPSAASAQERDNWFVAADADSAHILDAASIETKSSDVRDVSEWVFFRDNSVQELNNLEIDCRERRARLVRHIRMEPRGESYLVRSIPVQRLPAEVTQWRAAAEGEVRHSEIAFACAGDAERAANPNWRRVTDADMEQTARAAFSPRALSSRHQHNQQFHQAGAIAFPCRLDGGAVRRGSFYHLTHRRRGAQGHSREAARPETGRARRLVFRAAWSPKPVRRAGAAL